MTVTLLTPTASRSSIGPGVKWIYKDARHRVLHSHQQSMPAQTSCTPEGGLEALAEALFTDHRYEIPCLGEDEQHVPLSKDKAGHKDSHGRLYRYWTCTRCHPRTKTNCRSYIKQAQKVLGREVVEALASRVLREKRASGQPCNLLDAWIRGKLTPGAGSAPSQAQKKRKSYSPQHDTPSKRPRSCPEPYASASTENETPLADTEALKAAHAARTAIDRWIAALTGTTPSSAVPPSLPKTPVTPSFDTIFVDDSDLDEVILLPTPPTTRTPLRPLSTNVSDPTTSPDTVRSLVRRFKQATDSNGRSTVRKEAKRLGLTAEFERERSKGDKPPLGSRPSTTPGRLFEHPRSAESQVDRSGQVD